MPLLFAIVCGVSWTVGWGTSRAWGVGKRWEKFVISCSMFQNVHFLRHAFIFGESLEANIFRAILYRLRL